MLRWIIAEPASDADCSLRHSVRRAPLGMERVDLEVFASNEAAIALYPKFGFVVEGMKKRARKLDGKYDDDSSWRCFPVVPASSNFPPSSSKGRIRTRPNRRSSHPRAPRHRGKVDGAGTRFVPSGIVCDLHVLDVRQVSLKRRDDVAFHDVGVVDVELESKIVGAHLLNDIPLPAWPSRR